MKTLISELARQFREVRSGKLWMGENFGTKLGRLSEEDAFKRPGNGLHSAAEVVAHLTAWRRDALLKIERGEGRLRDRDEANWPPVSRLREQGWDQILREFDDTLEELLRLLAQRDDTFLEAQYYDQDYEQEFSFAFLLEGLLHHDLYHLGQLGLITRMLRQGDGQD